MAKKFLTGLTLVNLPSDPSVGSEGELYFNTSASVAKIYQAGAWSVLGSGAGGGTTVSTTEPASPEIGDSWYKNDTGEFYVYDGTYWIEVSTNVSINAESAQDAIAPLLNHGFHENITATYNDASNRIILSASAGGGVGNVISVNGQEGVIVLTTSNIAEGTNRYFTNQRATDALTSTLSNYLTLASASSTYLTQSDASSTYLTQSNALTTYLTQANASTTYLTSADATATYATNASLADYLTTLDASNLYLTQATASSSYQPIGSYLTSESDPVFTASESYNITSASTSAWNDAYGWGDHSSAGYLTSYTEVDTLENVTDRGATSSNAITISNTTEATSATTGALIVSGGVGVAKDLWIDGNLHVAGTTTTENTKTVATNDNLIYLNAALDSTITNAVYSSGSITYTAENLYTAGMDIRVTGVDPSGFNIAAGDNLTVASATPTYFIVVKADPGAAYVSGGTAHAKEEANPDLGFAGGYYDTGYAHAGLFRDASDGTFKFFDGYTPEPDESVNIDTGHASFSLADISASNAYFSGSVSGTWNGSAIPTTKGGTGLTSIGSAGYVLAVNGTATGLEWIEGGGSGAGNVVSTTPPPSPTEGMGWFDNGTGKLYIYDGTFWVEASNSLNDEAVMDIVSTMIDNGTHTNLTITYSDLTNALSFDVLSEPITDFITLNPDVTGTPSTNAGIIVNRGDLTDVAIRFNETEDAWEYTNDGVEYQSIGSGGGAVSTSTALSNSFWLGA